jgi:hypothetical protein
LRFRQTRWRLIPRYIFALAPSSSPQLVIKFHPDCFLIQSYSAWHLTLCAFAALREKPVSRQDAKALEG